VTSEKLIFLSGEQFLIKLQCITIVKRCASNVFLNVSLLQNLLLQNYSTVDTQTAQVINSTVDKDKQYIQIIFSSSLNIYHTEKKTVI
jgi:hypothetical protein